MFEQSALVNEIENLRRFALRLTGKVCDAEDLLQSTIVRAIEKKHLFQDDTDLFKWSSKIMFNLFVSDYRRKTKFESQYDPESYLEMESVEASQEVKTELSKVGDAMNLLSNDHKEILILVCVKGMQYQEVSEALQIPVGTVRSRLARAREALQTMINKPSHPHVAYNTAFLQGNAEGNRTAA
jgi:RNA polymerase sigma-70 factor (ECF subfamily)